MIANGIRKLAGLLAFLLWSAAAPVAAMDVCASAGKIEARPDKKEPCAVLAYLAEVAGKCAAEILEDPSLQRHAAGILKLERQTQVDESVLRSLRKLRDNPESSRGMNIDPAAFDRQMAVQDSLREKNRTALGEKRSNAMSAGYSRLAEPGYAQAVITNAVWRYLDIVIRPQVANCGSGGSGLKSAGDFAGMLAVSLSHGNPIETQIMRQILEEHPGAQ